MSDEVIRIYSGTRVTEIRQDDIICCEASENCTKLKTVNGERMFPLPLKIMEEKLNENKFLRISRSCLVNLSYITGFQPEKREVIVGENEVHVISVRKRTACCKRINSTGTQCIMRH